MSVYNPADWYWAIGNSTTQVWSSKVKGYVSVTDADYVEWLKAPTNRTRSFPSLGALAALLAIQAPANAPSQPVTMSSLAFMALFTQAEETAIATAALANVAVFVWWSKMLGATSITLSNPEAIGGVNALVAAGLLTQARATQVPRQPATSCELKPCPASPAPWSARCR